MGSTRLEMDSFRVLVVEDDDLKFESVSRMLNEFGITNITRKKLVCHVKNNRKRLFCSNDFIITDLGLYYFKDEKEGEFYKILMLK